MPEAGGISRNFVLPVNETIKAPWTGPDGRFPVFAMTYIPYPVCQFEVFTPCLREIRVPPHFPPSASICVHLRVPGGMFSSGEDWGEVGLDKPALGNSGRICPTIFQPDLSN